MKQKVVASFLAIMLFMTLFCVCFAEGYGFTIVPESDVESANKGDSFSVTFYVNSITHENGMLGLDARIFYDPSHLKLDSVKEVFPSEWGSNVFMAYSEEDAEGKKAIDIIMFYDGNMDTVASAKDDNTFGVALDFTVVTSSATNTTIRIPEGETLTGPSGTDGGLTFPESLNGIGGEYTLSLNKAPDSSTGEQSSEEIVSSIETSVEQISSEVSDDNTSVSEVVSAENSSSEAGLSSTIESVAGSNDDSSDDKGKKDGVNIILWLVVACVAVAIIAVVVYVVKNKKDDMNPVNPG